VSEQKHFELCVRPLIFFRDFGEGDDFSLRSSAYLCDLCVKKAISAQRYAEHRREENPTGKARVQVKIDGAETSKRLRSDLPLI
jgi:hypothetical protein